MGYHAYMSEAARVSKDIYRLRIINDNNKNSE